MDMPSCLLCLELIALPGPGEFLMGYAGVLVFQDKLNWALSMLAAGLGSCAGVSISYWIGYRLGPAIYKYGERIHFGKDRMKKTSRWLAHYGNKLFLIVTLYQVCAMSPAMLQALLISDLDSMPSMRIVVHFFGPAHSFHLESYSDRTGNSFMPQSKSMY
ncbi:VTT domain-containing protein [Bacillus stercoris]|nr:VTT domain-containing protein [Bacillus stercoris]MDZ5670127.1 VTT domain-containing protein [Bacillus stercoris]